MTDLRVDVDTVPLDTLYPDPGNVRSHDDRNLEAIKASLRDFGQVEPLIADMDGKVLGGNARLEAMQALGWDEAQVVHLDIDEPEATKLALALNRTADLAGWQDDELETLLEDLAEEGVTVPGFEDDLDELLNEPPTPIVDVAPDDPVDTVWVLAAVPVHDYPDVSDQVAQLQAHPSAWVETTANNDEVPDAHG